MKNHARYRVDPETVDDLTKPLLIEDMGPWDKHPTVTNDAEHVVRELVLDGYLSKCNQCGRPWAPGANGCFNAQGDDDCDGVVQDRRLFYVDSEGRKDEILIKSGIFAGFAPVNA